MKPKILLDFDGVLFNSAFEAYQVCENIANRDNCYRRDLNFDEFMNFRTQLTDAWQFCRLYQKDRVLFDVTKLHEVEPDEADWAFSKKFFAARVEMIKDPNWAKFMSPYAFFYQLRPFLLNYPETFKILSTRNKASIQRTLEFFEATGIEIFGQEAIREHGSKLNIAKFQNWLSNDSYVVYIDDMNRHLEPFEAEVDLCMHADWGYDSANENSYTQHQAFQVIGGFLKLSYE